MQNGKVQSVLVIDDDSDDFELVAEVVQHIDPAIAVTHLDRCKGMNAAVAHFDMVLLDINMPAHDGFWWLKGFRENGYNMPVVMYTNSDSPAHIRKAYGEGATLFFNKPESYTLLTQGLKKLLALDWSNPCAITEKYNQNGKCGTFKIA